MITTDIFKYESWSKTDHCPVYLKPWYLDVVCGVGQWQPYVLLLEGKVAAVWVCNISSKWAHKYSINPELTPYHGLHVVDTNISNYDLQKLIASVRSDFHYVEHDLPPHASSYLHSSKKTFVIPQETTVDQAWTNMKSDYRRKIKKAEAQHSLVELGFDHFREILETSFAAKAKKVPYNLPLFSKLDSMCLVHQHRTIIGLQNNDQSTVAAAYFLHDKCCTYYMAGGHTSGTNPMYQLLWEGIKASLEHDRAFDFEGSMIPGVAQFFRGFGGIETTYPVFTHSSAPWIDALVSIKKRLR